jgi:hypothetical protein
MKDEKPIAQSFILAPSAFILYGREMRPMEQQKKEWVKPELLVLVRNKPEEQVLSGCKVTSASVGSGNGASNCASALGCGYPCDVYVSS